MRERRRGRRRLEPGPSLRSRDRRSVSAIRRRLHRRGLSPDGGQTWTLRRIVGQRRASELILTNRRLSAEEAHTLGIVTEVVDDDQLWTASQALAVRISQGPTEAFGATKRLLRSAWTSSAEEQMAAEARSIARLAPSTDGREGVRAFLDKRPPRFVGSDGGAS